MGKASAWRNWLQVGLGIKRWLVVLLLAITLLGLGLAYLLVDAYREVPLPPIFAVLTLQFMPAPLRAASAPRKRRGSRLPSRPRRPDA